MKKRKILGHQIAIHVFFILFSLVFLLPMLLILSISFSDEATITAVSGANAGYHLIPRVFSLDAYRYSLRNPHQLIQAYKITAAESILSTLSSLVVLGMVSYPLSRSSFAYRKPITFIIFFTMLFSGGQIPSYIVNTRLYHLGDTFWIYILPGIAGGAWNTFVIRTFFKGLPEELFESAKIDGARELTIFFRIALPLSTPVFATIGFMKLLGAFPASFPRIKYALIHLIIQIPEQLNVRFFQIIPDSGHKKPRSICFGAFASLSGTQR